MDEASTNVVSKGPVGFVGRIPVRNLWLLMLYASNLVRYLKDNRHSVEESPDELPDLIAELLSAAVHRRLRRNLTLGYRQSRTILSRIRGRECSVPSQCEGESTQRKYCIRPCRE